MRYHIWEHGFYLPEYWQTVGVVLLYISDWYAELKDYICLIFLLEKKKKKKYSLAAENETKIWHYMWMI